MLVPLALWAATCFLTSTERQLSGVASYPQGLKPRSPEVTEEALGEVCGTALHSEANLDQSSSFLILNRTSAERWWEDGEHSGSL